jgi:hypothetical protein
MKYAVIIEAGERNYSAYVPDLPGCIATGKTSESPRSGAFFRVGGQARTRGAHGRQGQPG